jgi:hypothetical protein
MSTPLVFTLHIKHKNSYRSGNLEAITCFPMPLQPAWISWSASHGCFYACTHTHTHTHTHIHTHTHTHTHTQLNIRGSMKPHTVAVKTGRRWKTGITLKLLLANTCINFLLKFKCGGGGSWFPPNNESNWQNAVETTAGWKSESPEASRFYCVATGPQLLAVWQITYGQWHV